MIVRMDVKKEVLYQELERIKKEYNLNERKIIIFGMNNSIEIIQQWMSEQGFEIFAYIDNSKKKVDKYNRKNNPKKAYLPNDLLRHIDKSFLVLIRSRYYGVMRYQVEQMGYREGKEIDAIINPKNLEIVIESDEVEGYREISTKEYMKVQLEILKYVAKICEENNLRYFLAGGTLIGAIRHQGFIPWDDDIDIYMPMPDYQKLAKLLQNEKKYQSCGMHNFPDTYQKFFMRIMDNDTMEKRWAYPFLITKGISIDVFPVSGLPHQDEEKYIIETEEFRERFLTTFQMEETPNILQERKKMQEEVIRRYNQYEFDKSAKVACCSSTFGIKEIVNRDVFTKYVKHEFEKEYFNIPVEADYFLDKTYGNYMELPSEEKRDSLHFYKAYKKENKI